MKSGTVKGNRHWNFWIIGGLALLWNAMGVANLIWQLNPANLASMPELHRIIAESRPIWATLAFAVAVIGGLTGTVLLLFRNRLALPTLIASLVAMVIHMLSYFDLANAAVGLSAADFVLIVVMPLAVSVFLVWYAKRCED
jgi:hypothetical protein